MFTKRCLTGTLLVVLFLSILASYKVAEASDTIKIGYLVPLTGPFARIGADMRDGWLLYLGQIGNRVRDKDIQVIIEDTQGKPDVGLTKTRKLVEKDNVDMLGGIFSTGVAYAIRDYVHSRKIPLMITNAGGDDLTRERRSPYILRCSLTNSMHNLVFGNWVYKKLGKRKLVIIGQDYPGSYEWCGGMAYSFILAGGKVIQELYTPMGTPDFAPYLTAINQDADLVYNFHIGHESNRFHTQYHEYGLYGKIQNVTNVGELDETAYSQIGEFILGTIGCGIRGKTDSPEYQAFFKSFKEKFGRDPGGFAETSYGGAMFVIKALEKVNGNIEDKETFLKVLRGIKLPDFGWGPLSFDEYQNIIRDVPICKVVKEGNALKIAVIDRVPQVSQFWPYSKPEEFFKKVPNFGQMKGKWVGYNPVR